MRVPLLLPLLSFTIGILISDFGVGLYWGVGAIALAIVSYLYLLRFSSNPIKSIRVNKWHSVWVIFLFVGTGMICCNLVRPIEVSEMKDVVVSGRVEAREAMTYGDRITVDVYGISTNSGYLEGRMKSIVYSPPVFIHPGDLVEIHGDINPISDSPDKLPSGYTNVMRHKGITASLYLGDEKDILVTGYREDIMTIAGRMRDRLDIFISHTSLASPVKSFLKAMLLGDRGEMDDNTRAMFADAGVAHVLALSGLHVGIIVMILMWLLFPFSFLGSYKLRCCIAIPLVWAYAFLTGLSPTIVRAATMTTCMMIGVLIERKHSALNSLCAAVFILEIADPACIFDVGMQLSVICVASILIFVEKLNPLERRERPWLYILFASLLTTLVATFSTWPLTALYFRRFPLMFLPVNIIVLPLLPVYIFVSILYLLAWGLGFDAGFLRMLLEYGYNAFHSLASFVADGSALTVIVGLATVILWMLGMVLLATGISSNDKKSRILTYSGLWIMMIAIVTVPLFRPTSPTGFIVGRPQGNILITEYNGGIETETIVPRGETTFLSICGKSILVVDSPLSEIRENLDGCQPDLLIVGGHFTGTLRELEERFIPGLLLIHPSVHHKREQTLSKEATGTTPLHSLRKDGVFRCFSIGEEIPE